MKRTNTTRSTWKGRPGETYDLLATTRRTGPRVNVHRWLDTNAVEVRAISGDAFRDPSGFREYSNENLQDPTPEQLAEAEQRALVALAEARDGTREPMTTAERVAAASAPPTNLPPGWKVTASAPPTVVCADCGHVHEGPCPYVADPATCQCGADHGAKDAHWPHAHISASCVVVIYGEDMAERVVGPFANGASADEWIAHTLDVPIGRPVEDWDARPRVDTWADVFTLEEPKP